MPQEQIQYPPVERFDSGQLVRDGLNLDLVEQITRSFATVGQLQPVRARRSGDRLTMVDGHHRLAAAVKAGWKTLACLIEEKELGEADIIERQLISNCLRESPKSLEAARAVRKLMEVTGCNASQAAAKLSFSAAKVSGLLKMLSLSQPIIDLIEAGKIPASGAYELARIDDPAQQAELARQIASGRLTRDGVIGERKAARRSAAAPKSAAQPGRVTAMLGAGRSVTVTSPGLSLERFIDAIEEVLAKARRVRTRGVELQTFVRLLRDEAKAGS